MTAVRPSSPPLPAPEAYRRWAASYDEESALTHLENRSVLSLTPPLRGRSLLDAGCGSGRRMPDGDAGPGRYVGVDLVPEMLAGRPRVAGAAGYVAADVRALPFPPGVFDVVWLRLAVGHLGELHGAYHDLGRVAGPQCRLLVSDFHPRAVAAGHARTFRDVDGCLHAVEHHVHTEEDHRRAAARTGWSVQQVLDVAAGEPERPFYERAGRLHQFDAEQGLPLVLIVCLAR